MGYSALTMMARIPVNRPGRAEWITGALQLDPAADRTQDPVSGGCLGRVQQKRKMALHAANDTPERVGPSRSDSARFGYEKPGRNVQHGIR
jgi:hypothetical protein